MHMHNAKKQPDQIPNDINTKTPGIQLRNSASYPSKLHYVLSNHYTEWRFETHFLHREDKCLKLIMFRHHRLRDRDGQLCPYHGNI